LKILLATDGSPHAKAALHAVIQRPWPPRTELRILSVIHPIPYFPDPLFLGAAIHADSVQHEEKRAAHDVEEAAKEARLGARHLRISTRIYRGSPKKHIVDEAKRWPADLVVVGAQGHGPVGRFLLGSVAHAVTLHAPCSVEVVRALRTARRSKTQVRAKGPRRGR
jgi:nucleotide-binding universal stress UspA family protein